MAYISGFSDNQLIGVDDLNAITKRLVTSGVGEVLSDGGTIEVERLNDYTAVMVTDGVVPEDVSSLRVTKSGNTLTVEPGLAFFNDGSFLEVTENEKLTFTGSDGYVYLLNDLALGERKLCVGTDYPTGDFVLLAQITDAKLADKRKYAKGKLPSYASYSGYPLFVSQKVTCTGASRQERKGSFTVDLGGHPLNGIAIKEDISGQTKYNCTGVCFFDENKKVSHYLCKSSKYDNPFDYCLYSYYMGGATYARLTFSCTADGVLTVNVLSSSGSGGDPETITELIEFIVF